MLRTSPPKKVAEVIHGPLNGQAPPGYTREVRRGIMKEVLSAQGQTVEDAELDAGLAMIAGQLEQGQALDQKIDMVKEGGKWLMCPSN